MTDATYRRLTRKKHTPEVHDVIIVRRGSYRILGTVAMASERDRRIVLTRELLTLRVCPDNPRGLTPHNLMALLSSDHVSRQIPPLVSYDTNLPDIGDRWTELHLPGHKAVDDILALSAEVEQVIVSRLGFVVLFMRTRQRKPFVCFRLN